MDTSFNMNKSDNNKVYFIEKVIYISVLFITSIVIIITMFLPWINVEKHDGKWVEMTLSLPKLFNEIMENPIQFMNSFREDTAIISIFFMFLVIFSIVSIVLIVVFLIRLGTTLRNPEGAIVGNIAILFSLSLLLFLLLYKIALNIHYKEILNYYSCEVATAPYVILVLSLVNIVIIKRLANLKLKTNKEIEYQNTENSL